VEFLEAGSCSGKDGGNCRRRHEPRSNENKGECFFGKAYKFKHVEKPK